MNTTFPPARRAILPALCLAAALPAIADQPNSDPAATRFAELVPWMPESLPPVGEVLAFEEHQHFVFLEGTRDGTNVRLLLLRPDILVADLWPFDPEIHNLANLTSKAELDLNSAAGKTAKRVIGTFRAPESNKTLRLSVKEDRVTVSDDARVARLVLPASLVKPGYIEIESTDGGAVLDKRRLPDGIMPLGEQGMRLLDRWDSAYRRQSKPAWDSGIPSVHLKKAVESGEIKPGRAVILGCGTGTNALYLAGRGFAVTAIDIAPTALKLAEAKAREAELEVRWLLADVLAPPADLERFDFIFDRGCYHGVRRGNAKGYVETVRRLSREGTKVLIIAGNANEERHYGPPRVKEEELRGDFTADFDFLRLDTIRFGSLDPKANGALGWSILLRRK